MQSRKRVFEPSPRLPAAPQDGTLAKLGEIHAALQHLVTVLQPKPAPAPILPPYNIRKFLLDSARTDEEINIPGDSITAYTDGTLVGTFIKFDDPTNDAIPLHEFNPYYYPAKFDRLYLTHTQQIGKYLRLHIGREAGAEAAVEITSIAPKEVFYTIRSDKDTHFAGALGQYEKEDENLSGLITNTIKIVQITLQADQQLRFKVMFWSKDTFDDTDLDVDTFIGEVDIDLATYGIRIGSANQWYLDIRGIDLRYRDDDNSNELHVSVLNMSGTGKTAGSGGEVVIEVAYAPIS